MYYSKGYLKEKWDPIKNDIELLLNNPEQGDYVEFPEGRCIRENLADKWCSIAHELGIPHFNPNHPDGY